MAKDAFSLNLATAPTETQYPYPSYKWFSDEQKGIRTSDGLLRLYWRLDGPLESSIFVLSVVDDTIRQEPYYDYSTNSWHPVSQLPLTQPKVSSVLVGVNELDLWDEAWYEYHEGHSEPHLPTSSESDIVWSITDEYRRRFIDRIERDDDEYHYDHEVCNATLLKCCGMDRPLDKRGIRLEVTPAADGPDAGYVTVQDYVTAVHPWLMGMKTDILAAMGAQELRLDCDQTPLAATTDLTVESGPLSFVRLYKDRQTWYKSSVFAMATGSKHTLS